MTKRGMSILRRRAGLTLVELMVTVGILGVGVMASVASFRYISTSIQFSKGRTLATNLCQEQVEKLKNLSYYTLLVTTVTASAYVPSITYDTGNYPPQALVEGGLSFTRVTRVEFVYRSGTSLTVAPFTSDDTALKQISVYTFWKESGEWKYQEVHNLMANPAANPLSATFSGTVTNSGGTPISGAVVQVVDNPNWYGSTDSTGFYRFSVSQGSYTLMCSSQPYYPSTTSGNRQATSGTTTTINFTLTSIGSGTVTGDLYTGDYPVVSAVVASTDTAGGNSTEYIELYNPTTAAMNMGVGDPAGGGAYWSNYRLFLYTVDRTNTWFYNYLVYVSTYIPAGGYYLIANTTTVRAGGLTRTADAYYSGPAYSAYGMDFRAPSHMIPQSDAGGVYVYYYTGTTWLTFDRVAWSKSASGSTAPGGATEGSGIGLVQGLQPGEQLVRMTEPGFVTAGRGRAYDSDDNASNFIFESTLTSQPHNVTSGVESAVTADPAFGGVTNFNDLLSNAASCVSTPLYVGSCPGTGCRVCRFTNTVATGTWTMDATYNNYHAQVQNVTVALNVSTVAPNGGTTPSWTAVGNAGRTFLQNTTDYAFVSGYVYSATGSPLSGIQVTDNNGRSTNSSSTGRYSLLSTTGTITLTANPGNSSNNPAYVTQSRSPHVLLSGTLYDASTWSPTDTTDFRLSLGGVVRAYYRTGSGTPLPGRVAVAMMAGTDVSQGISDNSGYAYLTNLSTGTYDLYARLDPAESASPSSTTVTLASTGTAVTVATFTITNALGEITGQVLIGASTTPITTGVLVLATTATLTGGSSTPPPTVTGSNGALCAPCYYADSSNASAIYSIPVRSGSTPYNVYGWYSTINTSNVVTVTRSGPYSVSISTGGQIISQNLSW
jgi:hypothetical protein